MIGVFGIVLAVVTTTASGEISTECLRKAQPCFENFFRTQLAKNEACRDLLRCVKLNCSIDEISNTDLQTYINKAKNFNVDCSVLLQSINSGMTTSPSSSSGHGDTQRVISSKDGSLMNGGGNSLSTLNLKTLLIVICVFVLNM